MDNTIQLNKPVNNTGDDLASVTHHMVTLLSQLGSMETFIKRRFDEISMEINATSQQIDMSEEGMAKRFGEILGVMNAISYSGDGTTPANTGVELEAVIAETAKAANGILDAADKMNNVLYAEDASQWEDPVKREAALHDLRENVQNIMVACSFQDIAGQRIRKTLESINDIENRISSTLESMGIGAETLQTAAAAGTNESTKSGSTQDEIDALFGN